MTRNQAKEVITKWIDEIILSSKQLKTAEMQDERLVGKEYKSNLIFKANESIIRNKLKIMMAIEYIE